MRLHLPAPSVARQIVFEYNIAQPKVFQHLSVSGHLYKLDQLGVHTSDVSTLVTKGMKEFTRLV